MICVTLSKPTHEALIHQHHQVADQGVELVELRVDLMQQDPDVFRLIKNRPTPVVITCRRKEDGWRQVSNHLSGPRPRSTCDAATQGRARTRDMGNSAKLPFGQIVHAVIRNSSRGHDERKLPLRVPYVVHVVPVTDFSGCSSPKRSQNDAGTAQGCQIQHVEILSLRSYL